MTLSPKTFETHFWKRPCPMVIEFQLHAPYCQSTKMMTNEVFRAHTISVNDLLQMFLTRKRDWWELFTKKRRLLPSTKTTVTEQILYFFWMKVNSFYSFWAIIGHLTGENGVICFGDKSKGSYHLCHDMTSRIYFHHPLSFSKLWVVFSSSILLVAEKICCSINCCCFWCKIRHDPISSQYDDVQPDVWMCSLYCFMSIVL